MSADLRRLWTRGSAAALALCFFSAACERVDPQTERRFKLLVEEHTRLSEAVAAAVPGKAPAPTSLPARPSPDALQTLQAENEKLRKTLVEHQREQELAKSKTLREAVEQQVAQIRGLEFKKPVDYRVLNRSEIQQTITGKLDEVYTKEEMEHAGAALSTLGLLPENFPLREKYIELLSEQVAAFYDQHQHTLFMYEDASLDNVQNRVVLSHELMHALQDQHFTLKKLPLEIKTNDDRAAAASALVEGEATVVMGEYMLKNLSLQALKDSMGSALGQNMQQLESAPRYMREMLMFPYLRGQEFCAAIFSAGGYPAITRLYQRVPSSTAQILHPAKYMAEEEPIPVIWQNLEAKGQKPVVDNVVGEFGIRVLFTEWIDAVAGVDVGEGWRGDRYLAFEGGKALAWVTLWATEEDANEFANAQNTALTKRGRALGTKARVERISSLEVAVIDAPTAEWADELVSRFVTPRRGGS